MSVNQTSTDNLIQITHTSKFFFDIIVGHARAQVIYSCGGYWFSVNSSIYKENNDLEPQYQKLVKKLVSGRVLIENKQYDDLLFFTKPVDFPNITTIIKIMAGTSKISLPPDDELRSNIRWVSKKIADRNHETLSANDTFNEELIRPASLGFNPENVEALPSEKNETGNLNPDILAKITDFGEIFATLFKDGIDITKQTQLFRLSCEFEEIYPQLSEMEMDAKVRITEDIVKRVGVNCGDSIWISPQHLNISANLKEKIFQRIDMLLQDSPIISLNTVYEEFKSQLPIAIYNVEAFTKITLEECRGFYSVNHYLSKIPPSSWKDCGRNIVCNYLLSMGVPVERTVLIEALPHLPREIIDFCLNNNIPEIVGGGRAQKYAHVAIFNLTDADVSKIYEIITTNLEGGSITAKHFYELYNISNPGLFELYYDLDRIMLVEIVKYYYPDDFEYKLGMISQKGRKSESATMLIVSHFSKMEEFTLNDVYAYIHKMHYSVAIMGVLSPLLTTHKFLRMNSDFFKTSNKILINNDIILKISSLLNEELCQGYICSDCINNLLSYPYIENLRMNPYLLESIVRIYGKQFSPKLKLIEYYTGANKPRGIIVKEGGAYQSQIDVITAHLQKRHQLVPFRNINEAIAYLKEEKYMERQTTAINLVCDKIISKS